jgi:LmbE family N-acetylglucosaminyl deacetylase
MQEASSIPYEPARLRGERVLVLAPHPDDEAIGCGGLVAQHLREHRSVRIVIATDGAEAGEAADREEESRRGIALLGATEQPSNPATPQPRNRATGVAEVVFYQLPDRALANHENALIARLYQELVQYEPDLILVPSPVEIHPDHLALSRAFCEVVQRHETLFADLATARVAFYEVSQPLRPNALVDISDVADAKYAAVAAHESQTRQRDYVGLSRGLNAYRAMTLPAPAKYAEGYYVVGVPEVRTTPFSELRRRAGTPPALETQSEIVPISVVIRTKDRAALLREAIDSVRAGGYPCEIVVVNDGGQAVDPGPGVKLISHEEPRGRSIAANEGVKAATNAFVTFLDDDDLHYPEHLPVLAHATASMHTAWYTDAISAFLRVGPSGSYETHSRQRLYGQDFDRELLLADNYIPLPTLLVPRATFLDLGGFDAGFDLFEDWDFLIRLSARGDLLHVPRVTCEVRHFEGGSSIILASTSESPRYREAKLQVWHRHGVGEEVLVAAFERQKRHIASLFSDAIDARGESAAAHLDVIRLEREKNELLGQIAGIHNELNGAMLRTRELEGAVAGASAIVGAFEGKIVEAERLAREVAELRQHNAEASAALEAMRVEIARLNGLLDMIFRSRTWKLHTTIEKIRGRG